MILKYFSNNQSKNDLEAYIKFLQFMSKHFHDKIPCSDRKLCSLPIILIPYYCKLLGWKDEDAYGIVSYLLK